jgi:predicted permease
MAGWTCVFYVAAFVVAVTPFWFVRRVWRLARAKGWSWTNTDSRNMYVDATKTLITSSGIAVALLASSVSSGRTANNVVAFSAKVAVVCLIACVGLSLVAILALVRGHEEATGRNVDEQRRSGTFTGNVTEGKLTTGELLFILVPSGIGLSSFLLGLMFLGRIVFHI